MASNEKFHVTLSQEDGLEVRHRAAERGVSAVQIIREIVTTYLHQEQSQLTTSSSQADDLLLLPQQLQQLSQQIGEIEQIVKTLSERPSASPSSSDPQVRTMLQPVQNRLQQLEHQIGVVGNLTQQNLGQTLKGLARIEIWLQALHIIVEPLLLDYQTAEAQQERQKWLSDIQQKLDQYLEAHK
jgi:hypothetical protein